MADTRIGENLGSFLKEHLEADVIFLLAQQLGVSSEEAMGVYYRSTVAEVVEDGSLGAQYLPASYLADEVLKELRGYSLSMSGEKFGTRHGACRAPVGAVTASSVYDEDIPF